MTMTVRDPNFKYELGDIDDWLIIYLEKNNLKPDLIKDPMTLEQEERLFMYRKRNIDDERFVIKRESNG